MESDDFTRHYIIRYLSARELVLPPLVSTECVCDLQIRVPEGVHINVVASQASSGDLVYTIHCRHGNTHSWGFNTITLN